MCVKEYKEGLYISKMATNLYKHLNKSLHLHFCSLWHTGLVVSMFISHLQWAGFEFLSGKLIRIKIRIILDFLATFKNLIFIHLFIFYRVSCANHRATQNSIIFLFINDDSVDSEELNLKAWYRQLNWEFRMGKCFHSDFVSFIDF